MYEINEETVKFTSGRRRRKNWWNVLSLFLIGSLWVTHWIFIGFITIIHWHLILWKTPYVFCWFESRTVRIYVNHIWFWRKIWNNSDSVGWLDDHHQLLSRSLERLAWCYFWWPTRHWTNFESDNSIFYVYFIALFSRYSVCLWPQFRSISLSSHIHFTIFSETKQKWKENQNAN